MQEEVDSRTVTLVISATKLTGRVLKSAMAKYVAQVKAKKAENQLQYGSYTIQNRIFRVYFGYFGTLLFMTCVV